MPGVGQAGPTIPTLPTIPTVPGVPGAASSATPTLPGLPANTGQGTGVGTITPTSISSPISTKGGDNTLVGDFQATYGSGTGTVLADTLAGLGTATSGAVTATNQAILDAAGRQQANLEANNAAHGLSRDSSSSALSLGDFNSQVTGTIASTDAAMELSEENTLIQSLFTEGEAHGSDSSFMSSLGNFLQGGGLESIGRTGGAIAAANPGGIMTSGSDGGPSGLGTALEILAML